MKIKGKVWKFGDDINTDIIMPGFVTFHSSEGQGDMAQYCMHAIRPRWATQVKLGDIIVAGKNFGCGSIRPAPKMLQILGISAVIASSIARGFFRNAIHVGLPVIACFGIDTFFDEEETAKINMETGIIENCTRKLKIQGEALPKNSPPYEILAAGGMDNFIRYAPFANDKFCK